jgi:uncharacterized protein involved in exopolysaccharide biosynthesis
MPLFGPSKPRAGQPRRGNPAPSGVRADTLPPPPAINGDVEYANGHGSQGIFERPSGPFVTSLLKRKRLIVICCLLFAALGLVFGLLRAPTYESSASLQVGQVNPNSPGFMNYTQSATALAAVFSRAIYAEPVLKQVEAKLGVPASEAASRLSAEPLPLSPVFSVIATGPSSKAAEDLANATSEAVVAYVGKSNSASPQSAALLRQAHVAAIDLREAEAEVGDASEASILRAEAARNVARLRLEALSKSYIETVATQAPRAGLLSVVAGATTASSDEDSKLQLYGFAGLFAGLLVGCLLAVWLEGRRRRRDAKPAPAAAPVP